MREMTIKEIQKELGYEIKVVAESQKRRLCEIPVGEVCEIAGYDFIILEHTDENATYVLLKDFLTKTEFGNSCDYRTSSVKRIIDDFSENIRKKLPLGSVFPHDIDLTSDDGRKDFGSVTVCASLLTCDLYRRWVNVIDKFRINAWWWLATSYSTPSNEYTRYVRCVSSDGTLDYYDCGRSHGVRPFCKLNSSIFVS